MHIHHMSSFGKSSPLPVLHNCAKTHLYAGPADVNQGQGDYFYGIRKDAQDAWAWSCPVRSLNTRVQPREALKTR